MITLLFTANLACAVILFLSLITRKGETAVIWNGVLYMAAAFAVFWFYTAFGWIVLLLSLVLVVPETLKRAKQLYETFFKKNS